MLVFKFGGASVKDAEGIKNVKKITDIYRAERMLVVVSAMGKTTNALEEVVKTSYLKTGNIDEKIAVVKNYHASLINDLFENTEKPMAFLDETLQKLVFKLNDFAEAPYDELYDQVVSFGEIISTKLISLYFESVQKEHKWLDARKYIKTNTNFREGTINWEATQSSIELLDETSELFITQGFIGGTSDGKTTTLGREGSDYTASIFAYCLKAATVTIWKDVPGVLSADPRLFDTYTKFEQLSYQEAIEMTYYGATVIHPKTIKPLQNASIPLYVKPFLDPTAEGTVINAEPFKQTDVSAIIVKKNQVMLSISSKDFSFISESNIRDIYEVFSKHNVKCNVSQNSALSFTVCVDYDDMRFGKLKTALEQSFKVRYNDNLELLTVRHYKLGKLRDLVKGRTILLEQLSRSTAQLVLR